ncbi:pirin family protein [Arcicella aurantiaca]|nr:pirin [Arcicella aurantiaca]
MDLETQAQIYLADQRGISQVGFFRSFHTFNFGNYFHDSREPFGNLQVFNDDTLKAGNSLKLKLDKNSEVIIMPIVGGLEFRNPLEEGFLEAGQIQVFSALAETEYEIINPYETEDINFLQIWLNNASVDFSPKIEVNTFDFEDKNQLLPIFSKDNRKGFIGKYDGREKEEIALENSENNVFIFVLNGAFEVQDRLLHARDGLALSNFEMIDFEALSNDAIILILKL